MMTNHHILTFVNTEPFQAFRLNMVSGEYYEIRHPETIQVGRRTATIFTWMTSDSENGKERQLELSIPLIESIELLETPSTHN